MLKKIKSLFLVISAIVIVIIFIYGVTIYLSSTINQKKIDKVIPLVKKELKLSNEDDIRGCVYDKDFSIFIINSTDYFSLKNNKVKVLDFINTKTKEKYNDIQIEEEFTDVYWILENCR